MTEAYDAFGVAQNIDAEDTNTFRYCGEYFDLSSGTYYLRNRYYNPTAGRFLTEDMYWNPMNMIYGDNPIYLNQSSGYLTEDILRKPMNVIYEDDLIHLNQYTFVPSLPAIMQSRNLYVYCMSNPIRHTDPSGMDSEGHGGEVSAAFGGRVGAGAQKVTDDKGNEGIMLYFSGGAGTPSAGANYVYSRTKAKDIFALMGAKVSIGGSTPVAFTPVSAGGSMNVSGDEGHTVTLGAKAPIPKGHIDLTVSVVLETRTPQGPNDPYYFIWQ